MGFALDISKFAEKCAKNSDQVVRKTVIDIASSLVDKSPVGDPKTWVSLMPYTSLMTKADKARQRPKTMTRRKPPPGYAGGRFRANWQLGVDVHPEGEIDALDKSGAKTKAKARAQIPKQAAGHVYTITNNLPYAQALEDGHSRQAPHGMVGLTKIEFQGIIKKSLAGLE